LYFSINGHGVGQQTEIMKNNLRVARAIKNITQGDLAKEISVSRQTIHSIENNKFVPSVLLALKLADFFDMKVDELFSLDDSEKKTEL